MMLAVTLPGNARRRLSRAAAVFAPALVLTSLVAAPASAATTLGSTDFAASAGPCTADYTYLQGSPPAGTTYVAATAGVITKWRFHATDATQLKFKVLRHTTGNDYTVVAASDTVTAAAGTTSEFPGRSVVQPGDVLGITGKSTGCVAAAAAGSLALYAASDVGVGSTTTFSLSPTTAIPVAATIEADADGDGYGDETQDLCPTQAATQGQCVTTTPPPSPPLPPPSSPTPDTTVTKGPTQTKKSTVKYSFTSTVAGSTFECRLKGKGVHTVQDKTFQPCTSPRTYKKLVPGKYTFLVRAVSVAGTADATPAKVKLVVQPR